MELKLRNIIQDYKDKAKPYYLILDDFRNNFLNVFEGYLDLYKISKDRKHLDNIISFSNSQHKEFDKLIDDLFTVMRKEGIKEFGRLFTWIKILKKSSNFDWYNFRKIEWFFKKYDGVLRELKKLP